MFDPVLRHWWVWIVAASWQLALLVALVAALTWLLRSASPRLRHALWLLVLAKVFLPPGLATPVSVGRWGVGPLRDAIGLPAWDVQGRSPLPDLAESSGSLENKSRSAPKFQQGPRITGHARSSLPLLFGLWAAGCLLFWAFVVGRYARLVRAVRSFPTVDEGPLRIALERIAIDLGLRRVPDVVAADMVTSPFLFGVIRPTIVLPQGLLARWTDVELRAVLAHELVHWQRGDTWLGWLQTIAQGLFWFHPFLWWANGQLRHQRECACDEAVLRREGIAPEPYGEAIVRMLTMLRGRSLVSGSLVGIFEVGTNLQHRLEEIMNYHPLKRRFGWPSRLAIVATAVLLLPMAPGAGDRPAAIAQEAAAPADNAKPKDAHPRMVKSSPPQGATGVDPALKEISVTFDRDMEQGMSWTGGPPLFPPVDKSRQARWADKRTCVLPVKLEAGAFYRLGINSSSHQNFRRKGGAAAAAAAIYFSTKGATEEVERRVRVPAIVSLDPPNGSNDVEPTTASLRVTFSVPMGEGMSWTGGGAEFPKIPVGKTASWSDDGLTCTLPVSLEPEHGYQLGLNSVSHNNFQSKWGVPLEAVVYKFQTGAAAH
ncbi:MAG TPA: M56 family metallopeptidase [Pirellulales bacterium]|nr:M56 family metallopeptidase [Pirellulales bacterium]